MKKMPNMPHPTQSIDWEKEFDETFYQDQWHDDEWIPADRVGKMYNKKDGVPTRIEDIKQFISKVAQQAREEGRNEKMDVTAVYAFEAGQSQRTQEIVELMQKHQRTNTYEGDEAAVFKTTMKEVLSLLQSIKDEHN